MTTNRAPFRRVEIPIGRFVVEAQLTRDDGPPRWEVTVYENHASRPVVDYWIEPTWNAARQRISAIAGPLADDSLDR
jgi:hypothetical protein